MTSEVGHTQDAGWEIGVSRTVPFSRKHVWDVVTSPAGLAIWLGEGAKLEPDKGTPYETTTARRARYAAIRNSTECA
jgi:uncharacterized protein YndB with AHSA1/START domain